MGEKKLVAISGAFGFIGQHLTNILKENGYEVWPMVRIKGQEKTIFYDVKNNEIDEKNLLKCDVIIHLAGKNLMESRWNRKVLQEIYDSRVSSTLLIAKALKKSSTQKIFICASAIGFYGDRGDEVLTEKSSPGLGFLSHLCQVWEKASFVQNEKIRVVNLRLGMVLGKNAGFLNRLLPIFKMGLGAIMGNGKQFVSFIALEDLLKIVIFIIDNNAFKGPVNVVSPFPVTNKIFSKSLAQALHRPCLFYLPKWFIKIFFGQSLEVFFSSQRAYPKLLLEKGYIFKKTRLLSIFEEICE